MPLTRHFTSADQGWEAQKFSRQDAKGAKMRMAKRAFEEEEWGFVF